MKGGNAMHMATIEQFLALDMRVGTVRRVEPFPEARKPAFKLWIDFGQEVGEKKSSAQITDHYTPEQLLGRKVLGVVNLPPRQVGPFISEVLVLGVHDDAGAVVLVTPEMDAPDGARLC